MPLSILVPLVVIGIAGITVLLHFLGLTQPAKLHDECSARLAWLREFPEEMPAEITLSRDHRAALIATAAGPGLVWVVGADTTARPLKKARLQRTGKGLRIDLPDYSAPRIHLTLDEDEIPRWIVHMKEIA